MIFSLLLRLVLVGLVLIYGFPCITGVTFHGDWIGCAWVSLMFNLIFFGLEWLLGIIVFGINIGTLGLGVFITNGLRFVANLLSPAAALYATAFILPKFLQVSHFYPNGIVAGLVIGGVFWVSIPHQGKKR